jgi:hypothetical protein
MFADEAIETSVQPLDRVNPTTACLLQDLQPLVFEEQTGGVYICGAGCEQIPEGR